MFGDLFVLYFGLFGRLTLVKLIDTKRVIRTRRRSCELTFQFIVCSQSLF